MSSLLIVLLPNDDDDMLELYGRLINKYEGLYIMSIFRYPPNDRIQPKVAVKINGKVQEMIYDRFEKRIHEIVIGYYTSYRDLPKKKEKCCCTIM